MTTTALKKSKVQVKDLKGADYNPRFITDTRLKRLQDSMEQFGDLSGVVYNAHKKSRVLISGHQRIKTTEGKKTRIVTEPHKDKFGTIETGFIEVLEPNGSINKIPIRIVNWSDKKAEMAANI